MFPHAGLISFWHVDSQLRVNYSLKLLLKPQGAVDYEYWDPGLSRNMCSWTYLELNSPKLDLQPFLCTEGQVKETSTTVSFIHIKHPIIQNFYSGLCKSRDSVLFSDLKVMMYVKVFLFYIYKINQRHLTRRGLRGWLFLQHKTITITICGCE